MSFDEYYFELKAEGKLDSEIAEMLGVCESTLKRIKNLYDIELKTRTRKNGQGLSEQDLRLAVKNGISRRLALRRRREYKWSVYHAINVPKGVRPEYFGMGKEERRLMQTERQHQYYLNRKGRMISNEE